MGVAACLLVTKVLNCAAAPVVQTPSPELSLQLQAVLADASSRSGMETRSLKIAVVEHVTWLDGSLGCPEPDVMYTQSLVPGYRVRIEAAGEALDYHAAAGGALLLCPPGRALP